MTRWLNFSDVSERNLMRLKVRINLFNLSNQSSSSCFRGSSSLDKNINIIFLTKSEFFINFRLIQLLKCFHQTCIKKHGASSWRSDVTERSSAQLERCLIKRRLELILLNYKAASQFYLDVFVFFPPSWDSAVLWSHMFHCAVNAASVLWIEVIDIMEHDNISPDGPEPDVMSCALNWWLWCSVWNKSLRRAD